MELKSWEYDKDNDHMLCRCPDCGGRLLVGPYDYENPYHFCPYCGEKLEQGKIDKARRRIYGEDVWWDEVNE